MKKIIYQLASFIAIFIFAMCSNAKNIPVESNWELEYIYSKGIQTTPPEDHPATLTFLKGDKIAGETGCNKFFGEYTTKNGNLKFDKVGSTRMMCPQIQFENLYMETIGNTASYVIGDGQLVLKDSTGNIIALLKKIEPAAE